MISVIIPVYKVENYLSQCVDSLIGQTYKDIEIILVDDGSPDRCPAICDKYMNNNDKIKVIHQQNNGVSAARNAGLMIASGEYIGFVDPDDWVEPDMYFSMLNEIEGCDADLAICGYSYYYEDGKIDESRIYRQRATEILSQKEVMRRMSDIPPSIRHVVWNKLFRRSLLQDIKFPEKLKSSEDVWFLTDYLTNIKSALFIHKPYYNNCIREGSATHGGLGIHSLAESFHAHEYMYHTIVNTYSDLKDYSQAFLLDVYMTKYYQAKQKASINILTRDTYDNDLHRMRKSIHLEGFRALSNKSIYWKTRLRYLTV